MYEVINFQDFILNECCRDKVPVTIFLTNGFQIRGVIAGFDNNVVILETDGKQQMIYMHAISTVVPIHPMKCLRDM